MTGKPRECAIARNEDGSVTLSWRCVNAAASAGAGYTIQASRGKDTGEASNVLGVKGNEGQAARARTTLGRAA